MSTSRDLVLQSLEFRSPSRVPRQLWYLPWAQTTFPQEFKRLIADFPTDIDYVVPEYQEKPPTQGDPFAVGTYTDEWGCVFQNVHAGIIGEVREAIVQEWETDLEQVRIPTEWLTFNVDHANRTCAASDKFMMPGVVARPFERLQFIRTSEELYCDLADPPEEMLALLKRMHAFYCELYTAWCKTDIDGIQFIDDWGAQNALLVRPDLWRELFKPLYKDYIDIAHAAGKKAFMHSDGYILDIIPDLIEIGLDALNSQIFCMGIDKLAPFAGKITFWGEMDRQHLLMRGTPHDIDEAVKQLYAALWRDGGCIAQCEFGPGANPANVRQVFASWDEVGRN